MFFDLPRHEGKTLLRAVKTAKDLLAQSVSPIIGVENLKNPPLAVYYYVIVFNHRNNINAKPRKHKKKVQLFSCTILLVSRTYSFVNPGLYLLWRAKLARELSLFFRKCLIVNDLGHTGPGRRPASP